MDIQFMPAMDRRLGGPLPHQLANPTRVHLIPPEFFTRLLLSFPQLSLLAM